MRYYECNSHGNELGALNLICSICGNAALGNITKTASLVVTSNNGGLCFAQKSGILHIDKEDELKCPQCNAPMLEHSLVRVLHKDREHCVGCVICGNIDSNVFQICKDCILGYKDTIIPCDECDYNYSRLQKGIDIIEMKDHFGMEYAPSERQMELFKAGDFMRSHYINIHGKRDRGYYG